MSLTNEQIARVFAMYYGCEIIGTQSNEVVDNTYFDDIAKSLFCDRKVKLLLKPLSAITDEDAIEVAKILKSPHAVYHLSDEKNMIESTKYWIEHGLIAVFSSNGVQNHFAYQYLIQQSHAVPLFIAPNHPDNGKTAIELNLAIEATASKDHTQPNNQKSSAI